MLPLSFKEYISAVGKEDLQKKFQRYLELSSFPQSLEFDNKNDVKDYLESIYNTIIVKDVSEENQIKDITRLERVIKFMADNIGKEVSANNISNTMTNDGSIINTRTVEKYLKAFCNSYILYRADRYDIRGKKLLKTLNKYYLVDIGLRYALLGDRKIDTGRALENIVYLELLRRNRKVYIGKIDTLKKEKDKNGDIKTVYNPKEIDFVAEGDSGTEYYQVSESVTSNETLERELSSLKAVKNHNPKYLLTMDFVPRNDYDGIKQINILDWLLDE
jgi:predicted AAA+ superfamily ATPase